MQRQFYRTVGWLSNYTALTAAASILILRISMNATSSAAGFHISHPTAKLGRADPGCAANPAGFVVSLEEPDVVLGIDLEPGDAEGLEAGDVSLGEFAGGGLVVGVAKAVDSGDDRDVEFFRPPDH